ncbi:MAG: hypothetical protein ABIE46_02770 [Patescibacteria group bacterium]
MIALRGTNFGPVFTASGTLNFFGQGWPYHQYYKLIPGFDFSGSTMIAKTTTMDNRPGNMPLDKSFQPKEFRPKCIYVDFVKGIVLNSVGLSGPGVEKLLQTGCWQEINESFFISFMAVGSTKDERMNELKRFCQLIASTNNFKAKVGLEINISCPNTQHNPNHLIIEAAEMVNIADAILKTIPLVIKISVLIDPLTVKQIIAETPCDAIDVSNTIPWGQLPGSIDWADLFGSMTSPIHMFGGGGLSGKPLLSLVADWIEKARQCGIKIPIIGGGGILCQNDVDVIKCSGANAISIGTAAILRPWRVQGIINYANTILRRGL